MIHLELLFLFRSSEFFSVIEVSSAQGPKPQQQGKKVQELLRLQGFRSRGGSGAFAVKGRVDLPGFRSRHGSEHERGSNPPPPCGEPQEA